MPTNLETDTQKIKDLSQKLLGLLEARCCTSLGDNWLGSAFLREALEAYSNASLEELMRKLLDPDRTKLEQIIHELDALFDHIYNSSSYASRLAFFLVLAVLILTIDAFLRNNRTVAIIAIASGLTTGFCNLYWSSEKLPTVKKALIEVLLKFTSNEIIDAYHQDYKELQYSKIADYYVPLNEEKKKAAITGALDEKKENKKKPDSCLTSFLWKKIPQDSNDPHIPLLSDSAAVSDYSLNISDNGAYQEEKQPSHSP